MIDILPTPAPTHSLLLRRLHDPARALPVMLMVEPAAFAFRPPRRAAFIPRVHALELADQ